jgi:NitT/TauT family transport system permease protein
MARFGTNGGSSARLLDAELSGLDQLEMALPPRPSPLARVWAGTWPKLLAVGLGLLIWQVVVWTHWRPEYVLPSPWTVFDTLFSDFGDIMSAARTTLERGAYGFALALVIGTVLGALVARNRVLRAAFGSMITGLQTMPSIAWFPLAILLFKLTDGAILFVVVLGAAPSIANGLISGIDHIPPILLRSGRLQRLPTRDPARRPPLVRGRVEAGMGVRVAEPARRRAVGADPGHVLARPAAPARA